MMIDRTTILLPEIGCRIEYPGAKRDRTVEKWCESFLSREFREGRMTEAFCDKPLKSRNDHGAFSLVHVSFDPDHVEVPAHKRQQQNIPKPPGWPADMGKPKLANLYKDLMDKPIATKHPEPVFECLLYRPWMNDMDHLKYMKNPCSEAIEAPTFMGVDFAEGFKASTEQREPLAMKTRDQIAKGMSTYLHQQREKEGRKRATEHLRKGDEARVLHAAVAHHNPMEGLTGMAHVDTLRGEL